MLDELIVKNNLVLFVAKRDDLSLILNLILTHSSILLETVTLPAGVSPGDKIHVKAPDGRLNEIIVPPGMYPGSKFTVQFADGPPPTKMDEPEINLTTPLIAEPEINVNQPYVPMATAQPAQPQGDDDFASGFGSSSNKRY